MAFLSNSHRASVHIRKPRASVLDMIAIAGQRRALARLDARALEDMGLTREEALEESRRPFWDLPAK